MKHALLVLLSVTSKAWPEPAQYEQQVDNALLRAVLVWSALLVVGSVYYTQQPFTPENAFLVRVEILHFSLMMVLEAVNLVNGLIVAARSAPMSALTGQPVIDFSLPAVTSSRSALSYLAFVLSMLFFFVVVASFIRALHASLEKEAEEQQHERTVAAAAALRRPDGARDMPVVANPLTVEAVKLRRVVLPDSHDHDAAGDDDLAAGGVHDPSVAPLQPSRAREVLSGDRLRLGDTKGRRAGVSVRGDFRAVAVRRGDEKA